MGNHANDDLGAVLSRLLGVIGERESPILEAHGLTMWEYVVLSPLAGGTTLSQNELAGRSRRDPTRLSSHLDALSDRGLIAREVDESDRRRRIVRLTEQGDTILRSAQRSVRAMEDELLDGLTRAEQDTLRRALARTLQHLRDLGWERPGTPSQSSSPDRSNA
jgi:DNA-binding MarR family transcriptional regulator